MYRFTSPGDTFGSIGSGDKIEFLPGSVPDATGRNIKTDFKMRRDVNPHPNPRRSLNKRQDSRIGVMEVIVTGYLNNHDSTLGPKNLYNWSVQPSVNDDYEWGRFGITLGSFAGGLLNETPTVGATGKGYMPYDILCEDVEKPRDEVPFVAKFYRNGTITTK